MINYFFLKKKSYVDEKLKSSKRFRYEKILEKYPLANEKLLFWTPELCVSKPKTFDFIITVSLFFYMYEKKN